MGTRGCNDCHWSPSGQAQVWNVWDYTCLMKHTTSCPWIILENKVLLLLSKDNKHIRGPSSFANITNDVPSLYIQWTKNTVWGTKTFQQKMMIFFAGLMDIVIIVYSVGVRFENLLSPRPRSQARCLKSTLDCDPHAIIDLKLVTVRTTFRSWAYRHAEFLYHHCHTDVIGICIPS